MLGSENAFSYAIARTENLGLNGAIPFEKIIDAVSREGDRNNAGIPHMGSGWKNMAGIIP